MGLLSKGGKNLIKTAVASKRASRQAKRAQGSPVAKRTAGQTVKLSNGRRNPAARPPVKPAAPKATAARASGLRRPAR